MRWKTGGRTATSAQRIERRASRPAFLFRGRVDRLQLPRLTFHSCHRHVTLHAPFVREGACRKMTKGDVHVVFGTGPVGRALIDALIERHLPVRAVCRAPSNLPDGVQTAAGDASDRAFAAAATSDAAAVYQCLSPPYHRWGDLFPRCSARWSPPRRRRAPAMSPSRISTCMATRTARRSPRICLTRRRPGKASCAPPWRRS